VVPLRHWTRSLSDSGHVVADGNRGDHGEGGRGSSGPSKRVAGFLEPFELSFMEARRCQRTAHCRRPVLSSQYMIARSFWRTRYVSRDETYSGTVASSRCRLVLVCNSIQLIPVLIPVLQLHLHMFEISDLHGGPLSIQSLRRLKLQRSQWTH
jgi:hypothetical protein